MTRSFVMWCGMAVVLACAGGVAAAYALRPSPTTRVVTSAVVTRTITTPFQPNVSERKLAPVPRVASIRLAFSVPAMAHVASTTTTAATSTQQASSPSTPTSSGPTQVCIGAISC